MPALSDRIEFLPPAPGGTGRALAWALLAHLLLALALTWGVSWNRQTSSESFDAELWSALPQQAAPRAVEVPAAPPSVPAPPRPVVDKAPEPPQPKAPDIAIEPDKPKPPPKAEPEPKPQARPEPRPDPRRLQQEQQAQLQKEREANLQHMAGLAGASGAPSATGNAVQSSGTISAGYGSRIKARVKPRIVFTGDTSGNPRVEIEVRLAPDGTILGRPRVLKSSGNREWDEAVVRGFEATEVLPRDENGTVPPTLVIGWRPND